MNQAHITDMLDELFAGIPDSDDVREQKEELRVHLTEQVKDYMAKGLSFEESFQKAKDDMGDLDELVAEFKKEAGGFDAEVEEFATKIKKQHINMKQKKIHKIRRAQKRKKYTKRFTGLYKLASITPFLYIVLGFMIPGIRIWLLGWMIIPVSFIIADGISRRKMRQSIVALTPFIYFFLGVMIPGWQIWALGWIIIPVSGILLGKSPTVTIYTGDDVVDEVMSGVEDMVGEIVNGVDEGIENTLDGIDESITDAFDSIEKEIDNAVSYSRRN